MAESHRRDAARFLQQEIEGKVLTHCLEAGTGIIPDPCGHWVTKDSIASIFKLEKTSLTNWLTPGNNAQRKVERHPKSQDYMRFYSVLWVIHGEE